MNLDAAIQAQIDGSLIRASYLLYVDSTPPVRAWTGVGPIQVDPWGQDTTGGTYLGVGLLGGVPALAQLVNGTAARLDLSLSGVDSTIIDLATGGSDDIRMKPVSVGLIFMGEDWQPLSTPLCVFVGDSDVIRFASQSSPNGERSREVTLSIGSVLTGRRRPNYSYWTRAGQRARSGDDAFCDRVAGYNVDSELKWPP